MIDLSQKDLLLDSQTKFIKKIRNLVFVELKRRIQVLKLPNVEKLLSKVGIKTITKGKFDLEDEEIDSEKVDYIHKFMEVLEISDVYINIVEYEMGQKQI